MALDDLDLLFPDLGFDPTTEQIEEMQRCFRQQFIEDDFHLRDSLVVVKEMNSSVREFEEYGETFVHVITRKSDHSKRRNFDPDRANRIHWIRPILENHESVQIKYFEYIEGSGTTRHYYWYRDQDFAVILQPINDELLIITSFYVDNDRKRRTFQQRWQDFYFE